jgi:aryl-alcohol dehydrogenase-like predicted oxidoreductase
VKVGGERMKYRRLGRTGLMVSEIGFGAWGIGKGLWVGAEDAESLRALRRAVEEGVNFIDTALAYGPGHSERLVGQVVREMKVPLYVATKVPPKNLTWPAARGIAVSDVFPAAHIERSAEESLENLGLERIDLLQLHVWRDEYLDDAYAGWQEALRRLQKSGKVRFVGISVNDHDPSSALRAVASGLFDTAQIIYNIFDQTPEEEFFPACRKHDVGVIVRVPFDEGGLTGTITPGSTFPPADFRAQYFEGDRKRQVWERAEALKKLLDGEARTLPELALRFCLSHDAVSTVIPGMRRLGSVEANVAVSDGRRLSPAMLEKLKAHAWRRNFYD